jgi:GNAT superfamily N-acetyltransferase
MAGIYIGQPWGTDPTKLSLREFTGTAEDYAALAHIRNETMRAVSLPQDFQEMTVQDMVRFYNRGGFTPVGNAWLMFSGQEPVAAGVLYPPALFQDRPPGNFDMYVVPALWQHGLGSRLLAHLEQAARARGYPVLETTVAREDERSTRFLLNRGFQVVGQSVRLIRPHMRDLPRPDLPQGYAIRSLADLKAPPELYRDTTNRLGAYDPSYSLITPEDMHSLVESGGWEPDGVLFLFDPFERIVGVIRASTGTGTVASTGEGSRDDATGMSGYLHEVRLEPASRGRGLGMVMLAEALRYLAGAGVDRVQVDTPGENTPAYHLALKAGFTPVRHWLHFLKRLGDHTRQGAGGQSLTTNH